MLILQWEKLSVGEDKELMNIILACHGENTGDEREPGTKCCCVEDTRRRVLIKLLIESPGPRSPGTKVSRYKGLQNRGLQDRGFGLCAWLAAAPCQADLPGWPLRPGGPMCLVCRWPGWPMRQVVSWEIELQYWTYSCELNKHQSAILYLASWLSPEDFTAKLSLRTIAGSLLKYLLKFQVDEEAAVRTNTILFGNIASYLNDGVSRHKGLQVHRSPEQRSPGTKFSRTVVSRTEASVSVPWRAAAPWRADVPVGPGWPMHQVVSCEIELQYVSNFVQDSGPTRAS
ncbi:hypothetical protein C5167_047412 [Papaver somniferum]|uniref:Uncharacterized protein n=1 Tax=Papaver somniferum TaxID=3469 RepID=A0A4Y7LHA0_PAPSO|nr:hypothetical protein C5167_047412 [Papaver somniferum]